MSITTAIQNAQEKIANSYSAVREKGGTVPETQNLANLPEAIRSISGSAGETGDIIDVVNVNNTDIKAGDKVFVEYQTRNARFATKEWCGTYDLKGYAQEDSAAGSTSTFKVATVLPAKINVYMTAEDDTATINVYGGLE